MKRKSLTNLALAVLMIGGLSATAWAGETKRFWAVTAYDPLSRALLDSGGNITISSTRGVDANPDGSVDIYFGQKAPKGKERNFIKTDPDKGFFVAFRFYGPLEGYIEKTWVMNDFELID
jgi:hypothetical protein